VKGRIFLALGLATSLASADIAPEPREGHRFLVLTLDVDRSAVPQDRALGYATARRRGGLDQESIIVPLDSAIEPNTSIYLFVLPRADVNKDKRVKELTQAGVALVSLHLPVADDVPSSDPRFRLRRRARVVSVDPLRVETVEDAFESQAGEVLCRRPAMNETDIDEGLDPCDPQARLKRVHVFVRMHGIWLGSGFGLLLVGGVALVVLRRRKKAQ
jgi:hypothetical protein